MNSASSAPTAIPGIPTALDVLDQWGDFSSDDASDSDELLSCCEDYEQSSSSQSCSPHACSSDDNSIENWPRKALSRSFGHGCIHTAPPRPAPRGKFMQEQAYQNWVLVRREAQVLLHAVILKRVKQVWPALFCDALSGKLDGFSLDPRAFRSWLSEFHHHDLAACEVALERWTQLLRDKPDLRTKAVESPQSFFKALRKEMRVSCDWSDADFSQFFDLARRFIEVKAKHLSHYFVTLMDAEREHIIWRFDRLTEAHTRFVNRVVTHLQSMDERSFARALRSYMAAQEQMLRQNDETSDASELNGSSASLAKAYRGAAMVKHDARETWTTSSYGASAKSVCKQAQSCSRRKILPLDYSPGKGSGNGSGPGHFLKAGLAADFVALEEAHIVPASKIFSCYGVHFAKSCGWSEEELCRFNRTLEQHVTHRSVFGQDAEARFQAKLDELDERIIAGRPQERKRQTLFAGKAFMLIERHTLTETGSTNHMPSFSNQTTDHLSESKARGQGAHAKHTISQRLAGGLGKLLRERQLVNQAEVVTTHRNYFTSVEQACLDSVSETSQQVYPTHAATIRRVVGLVGAMDHLSAVRSLRSRYDKESSTGSLAKFQQASTQVQDWAERSARKCGVLEIWQDLKQQELG